MALFLRLLQFAKRYRGGIVFAISLVFISTGMEMVPPYMTRLLVDSQLSNFHVLDATQREAVRPELWGLLLTV